jgi:hypothetical protein
MQIALQGDMQGHDQIALMHTLSSLGRSLLSASLKVFQPRFRMTSPGKRLILGTLGGWGRQVDRFRDTKKIQTIVVHQSSHVRVVSCCQVSRKSKKITYTTGI